MAPRDASRIEVLERELARARGERDELRGVLGALRLGFQQLGAALDVVSATARDFTEADARLRTLRARERAISAPLADVERDVGRCARAMESCEQTARRLSGDISEFVGITADPASPTTQREEGVSALSIATAAVAHAHRSLHDSLDALRSSSQAAAAAHDAFTLVAEEYDETVDGLRTNAQGLTDGIRTLHQRRAVLADQLACAERSLTSSASQPITEQPEMSVALAGARTGAEQLVQTMQERDAALEHVTSALGTQTTALRALFDPLAEHLFDLGTFEAELDDAKHRLTLGDRLCVVNGDEEPVERQLQRAAKSMAETATRFSKCTASAEPLAERLQRGRDALEELDRALSDVVSRDVSTAVARELKAKLDDWARALQLETR